MFDKIVTSLKTDDSVSREKEELAEHLNAGHTEIGSHLKLLLVAATLTKGDMLEMGTGHFSTPVLHRQ